MGTALVTGASGFIGSHLVDALNQRGYQVRALLRASSKTENLDGFRYQRVQGHLGDAASLRNAVKGVDTVFHLAGVTSAPDRAGYFEANATGTRNLMEACAEEHAATRGIRRIVIVSSLAASGPHHNTDPVSETVTPHPVSAYGESKLAGETEALKYKDSLPITILRPPIVFGPKDKQVFLFIKGISQRIVPLLRGTGPERDKFYASVHSSDLVQALILAGLDHVDLPSGEIFFISSEDRLSFRSMIDQLGAVVGVKTLKLPVGKRLLWVSAHAASLLGMITRKSFPLNRDKLHELLPDYWVCSSEKARTVLGFKPLYDWRSGMQQTVQWYRNKGWI